MCGIVGYIGFRDMICNVLGSMMTRLSDEVLYTRAGPEIGVAPGFAVATWTNRATWRRA